MKVLFISSFIGVNNTGGSVSSRRNLDVCRLLFEGYSVDAFGFEFDEQPLAAGVSYLPSYKNNFSTLINYLMGNAGGLNFSNYKTLTCLIRKDNYSYIFLDGSLLGRLAAGAKKINPRIQIITFFRNVEKEFFKKSLKSKPLYALLYKSACFNEKLAAKYSDHIICFNRRDAALIEKEYKKIPGSIFPSSVTDRFSAETIKKNLNRPAGQLQLLFIGSDFYANTQGLKWFVKNVIPHINAQLKIVGKGLEKYKQELNSEKISVIGTVESVDGYYYAADAVVAPIFTGSGMKVKIAEALMMGKTIIGTTEAWEGYDVENGQSGFVCNTAQEFIATVNNCIKIPESGFNEKARLLYCAKYSAEAEKKSLQLLKEKIFTVTWN